MKYSRGRIIALTILSVTMVLALFGASIIYNFRDTWFGVAADAFETDPNYIPTFDDLYARISLDTADSGTVNLGQNTKLTLLEERYNHGILKTFLNSNTNNNRSYPEFQGQRCDGYPYPIFSDEELRSIARGTGSSLEIPVIMLDPYNYDDIVLFELTDMAEVPNNLVITRDGVPYENDVNLVAVNNSLSADQVYRGVPRHILATTVETIYDVDHTTPLLNVIFVPDSQSIDGYFVEIKNIAGNHLYVRDANTNELSGMETLGNGTFTLCDYLGNALYTVIRNQNVITVKNTSNMQLGEIVFDKSNHQLTNYEIGAVAYNTKTLRGMFCEQGLYEISFKQMVTMGDGIYTTIDVSFAFVIVNKMNYTRSFPRFNTNNRVAGRSEIYNYSYESEYPEVTYPKSFFDVKVVTSTEYFENDASVYDQRQLRFYNIGEYQMTSTLQYYSEYLYNHRQDFNGRGVTDGYITLKRYTQYTSVLNIFGFQAYYGGQHANPRYNGPLPFYDSSNSGESSDISAWTRDLNMTAERSGSVADYQHMSVSDALRYSDELASYITTNGNLQPVRTNFPPVKMVGNVAHATGIGVNGEKAVVLSTVAYRPTYGAGQNAVWSSKTMEVGAPFEDAGEYLVVVYFKVNGKLCQQTFYFEIVNAANIAFEVTAGGTKQTYYAGELELNQDLCVVGNQVKLSYGGQTTLGQFEVLPSVTLAYARFGAYVYDDQNIVMEDDGSFAFSLTPGQYRLTVKYGAHGKSTSVFNIIVDNTQATGIKANTTAKSLADVNPNIPANVAVVGAGEVTLTWDNKVSGINFNNVLCEFYEMVVDNATVNPNAGANYDNFPLNKVSDLYSAYNFSRTASSPNNGYHPVKTEHGWTLTETFTTAGLYRFTLIDEVGNETPFVLIIDNSVPTFIQSGYRPTGSSNTVSFNDSDGIKIGFGKNKLIKRQDVNTFSGTLYQPLFANLGNAGVLNNVSNAIKIPVATVEWSDSGNLYSKVDNNNLEKGYLVLNQEGAYYFRVTDVLGNVGEYYIVLTHDNCFGTVYADEKYLEISTESQYLGRGVVTAEPDAGTSLVTSTGGMTNRPYVTFAFNQPSASSGELFRVSLVYLQYYPMTYDVNSKNYPFAEQKVNNPQDNNQSIFANQDNDGIIYAYDDVRDSAGGTIRLALFNTNKSTPNGLYIITRVYTSVTGSDTASRDYYFIVDNQKMLDYEPGVYQTNLKVRFAEKQADAETIYRNNNELSSNRAAVITGFNSKYSWKHNSTTYTINDCNYLAYMSNNPTERTHNFDFPSLAPRFSYIHNGQTIALGEGNITKTIGDGANVTGSSVYRLVIADNARNLSCFLVEGNVTELKSDTSAPTSANWNYLTLNLDTGYGTKAEFVVNENNVIGNSNLEYDGVQYVYITDPRNVSQLLFRFESDPESMYADIDFEATMASWQWTANGVTQMLSVTQPVSNNGWYTFNLLDNVLKDVIKVNGSSLSVSLVTCDHTQTNYVVLFDSFDPSYNLSRVKSGDNLACTMEAAELPGDYVYGLSTDFVFENDHVNNPFLDTETITYREVDYTGEGTQQPVAFSLYTGKPGDVRIPFATLVGLRDNEMKYYFISETDYAGHTTSYIVQIQGASYVNAITFIGAISDEGDEIQIGVEMHASSSSVHQFFMHNNSFKFVSGDEYYMVIGSRALWHIGNSTGSGIKSEENLINTINAWINAATEKGTKCSYTVYDRIGDVEVFEFYNLRENATQLQLDCYRTSTTTNNMITLEVTNLNSLPQILFDGNLSSLFKIEIEDKTSGEMVQNVTFMLSGTSIYVDVAHELVIKVTDPFGRISTAEYHQQVYSTISFAAYGNTAIDQNGVVYVGDERGVSFGYLRTVYTVLIYDANTGDLLSDLQTFINHDMIHYSFKPHAGVATIQKYRIVATGRASGAVMFDRTFAFDTRLPNVEWKNSSDQLIDVDGQSFVSAVNLDISKSTVPMLFPVTISYTRTLNGQVESVTLKSGTQKVNFYQEGVYEVTLRNTVWAKQTFKFEIVQINDILVLVYDDKKEIEPSASSYKYVISGQETSITRYIFSTTINRDLSIPYPINEYEKHGLEIRKGQTNRILAGNYETGTDYYDYDATNNTLIWRLALKVGEDSNGTPVYTNAIYFATTGVSTGSLTDNNSISLQLNGNPSQPASGATSFTVPLTSAYHIIYNNFMTSERNGRLTVQLYCDNTVLRDDSGAPCYLQKGNLILVDCYYNGTFIKTMDFEDVFTINQDDAGYYEFRVHDLVGNYLYYGNSNDKNDINYKQNSYLLVVMTKPIMEINENQPVNGMIYNDKVELRVDDYGSTFLKKYHAALLSSGVITQDNKTFFGEYFRVTKLEVDYTGSNGSTRNVTNVSGTQSSFSWNKSGKYHVILTYKIYNPNANNGGEISSLLTADYSFQIIPSMTVSESFNMSVYPDIPIIAITRDNYKIHDTGIYLVRENNDEYMAFNADNAPGKYVVTMQAYNSILQNYITYTVSFNIQHKANSASSYFVLSSASGSSTTNAVTLYYNPYWLYLAQGNVTITLTKDYVTQEVITIDSSALANNYSSQELFKTSGAGIYRVAVRDAEGDVVYSDSWTIEAQQSTFGYIILAVVLGIAGIATLIFIRMRNKMTTK